MKMQVHENKSDRRVTLVNVRAQTATRPGEQPPRHRAFPRCTATHKRRRRSSDAWGSPEARKKLREMNAVGRASLRKSCEKCIVALSGSSDGYLLDVYFFNNLQLPH